MSFSEYVSGPVYEDVLPALTPTLRIETFASSCVVNLNDFADLASYELIDKKEGIFRKLELDEDLVNQMIMDAREKSFS